MTALLMCALAMLCFGPCADGRQLQQADAASDFVQGLGGVDDIIIGAVNEAVEAVGNAVEFLVDVTPAVKAAITNGRKCYVSIGRGARLGRVMGPTGAVLGGAVGALANMDDCKDALHYGYNAFNQVLDAGKSDITSIHCPQGTSAVQDFQACSSLCDAFETTCDTVTLRLEASCCRCEADCSSTSAATPGTPTVDPPTATVAPTTGGPISCASGSTPVLSGDPGSECDKICAEAYPNCPYYFRYSHQCCTCSPNCPAVSDPAAPANPAPSQSAGTCPAKLMGVNLVADLTTGVPVGNLAEEGQVLNNHTSKWVPVTTPDECCEACTSYPGCHAWTWKGPGYCSIEREIQPTACCMFKAVSGWQIEYKRGEYIPAFVSGLAAPISDAQCTDLQSGIDLFGGDLLPVDTEFLDTVVAAANPQECCNFCKAYVGCTAWTLSDPSDCQDRLGADNQGCCFLKTFGYTAVPKAGTVSGRIA